MSPSVELVCVPPDTVHKVWPRVCDLIYVAMKRGGMSAYRPVADSVLEGMALLWLAWDGTKIHAAAVTELQATEWRKLCVIVACGGAQETHRRTWLHLIEGIENYARAEGCAGVQIMGRPGWRRALSEYRRKAVILEKELA